jgi:uncharacterized protein YfaP (DUF2135 family)
VSFAVQPRACGAFPVNQSATVSYDDNRGNRRTLTFPVPSVTVTGCGGDLTDVFIRDNPQDMGPTPSNPPWWASPDIWTRHTDDGGEQHQNPQAGQRNYLYARVLNRGTAAVSSITVTWYYGASGLGLGWPAGWTALSQTRTIASIAPGATAIVSIPWDVPNIAGHFCLRTHITATADPISDYRIPWDNNVAQRNLHVVAYPQPPAGQCSFDQNGTATDQVRMDVINTLNTSSLVDVELAASGLPATAQAWLQPGALAGRWSSLDGLILLPDGRLQVLRFPARLYGIRMNPNEIRSVALEVQAPVNSRFTVGLAEYVRGSLVGGNSYQRVLPACPVQLPLIMKTSAAGTVLGRVVNAVNAQGISGAQVCVLSGNLCTTTNGSGNYTIPNVPAGTQTVRAAATGFISDQQSAAVPAGGTVAVNFALSPVLAQGEMRIVLTWGSAPRDLDSHLWLPASRPFHVFYANRGNCNAHPYACLDVDDVTSYGPETVTIRQRFQGQYVYAVYNYSGESAITGSNGRVQVYGTNGLVADFQVPNTGSGRWWYVFDLDGTTGAITPRNYVTSTSPGPYTAAGTTEDSAK